MSTPQRAAGNGDVDLSALASALVNESRAIIMTALADGRSRPAGELARVAGVSASTASSHLARLQRLGVVVVEQYGRHRYYRWSSEHAAHVTEVLSVLAPVASQRSRPGRRFSQELQAARMCYDHLAGALGVQIMARLVAINCVAVDSGAVKVLSLDNGPLHRLDVDPARFRSDRRRPVARVCLDWAAGEQHLAGALGAALANRLGDLGWFKRTSGTRALTVTDDGWNGLADLFEISRPEQPAVVAAG